MPSVEDVSKKYPWLVIDPSSLIGDSTPKNFEELSEKKNPLWRQFYLEWLVANKKAVVGKEQLTKWMSFLNEVNRKSKSPAIKGRYETYTAMMNEMGSLEEFHEAIREIKDAIEEKAKKEGKKASEIGTDLSTDVLLAKQAGKPPDEAFVNAAANLSTSQERATLLHSLDELLEVVKDMVESSQDGEKKVDKAPMLQAEKQISMGLDNLRDHYRELRDALEPVQKVLPYLMEPAKRLGMMQRARFAKNDELVKAYEAADAGVPQRALWTAVSKYGQAIAAMGVEVSNVAVIVVEFAKEQAENEMSENFGAAFKKAAFGLIVAKTAVTSAGVILGFFPPFGPPLAAGLGLAMTIIDKATRTILVYQAKNDPTAVISHFGKSYQSEEEQASLLKKIAEKAAEHGIEVADLLQALADLGQQAADIHVAISRMDDVARAIAKGGIETAGTVLQGTGNVISLLSLAWDWKNFHDDQKKELRNRGNLTDADVDRLQEGLKSQYQNQASNRYWDVRQAVFLGMDGKDYEVEIGGVRGVIRHNTFVFAPADRTEVHQRILKYVDDRVTELTFHGATLFPDWKTVAKINEPKQDGHLTAEVTAHRRSGQAVVCKVDVSVEGRVEVTGVDLPTSASLLADAPEAHPVIRHDGHRIRVRWETAEILNEHTWYFTCKVQGARSSGAEVELHVEFPRQGKPKTRDMTAAQSDPDALDEAALDDTAPVDEDDRAKVLALLTS